MRLAALGLKLEETPEGFTAWLFSLAEVKALAAHLGRAKTGPHRPHTAHHHQRDRYRALP